MPGLDAQRLRDGLLSDREAQERLFGGSVTRDGRLILIADRGDLPLVKRFVTAIGGDFGAATIHAGHREFVSGAAQATVTRHPHGATELDWRDCGDGFQCADAEVPLDYSRPHGRTIEIPVIKLPAKDPAHRIGTLFGGAGGPGQSGIEIMRRAGKTVFAPYNERFDLVSFDQRGVGTIDCGDKPLPDEELATPDTIDVAQLVRQARKFGKSCYEHTGELLPYVTTGNAARDLDRLRAAVGEEKLTYIGGSYGTMLGATYSSLFPGRVRAMALDAPVDVDTYVNRPLEDTREQVVAFEGELDRFFTQCAAHQATCGFGGDDPEAAFDALLERLDREPVIVLGDPGEPPLTITGNLVRLTTAEMMYKPQLWPALALALAQLQVGDGSIAKELAGVDLFGIDDAAFWSIVAADGDHPRGVAPYLDAVRHTFGLSDHFWWVRGYQGAIFGFWPVRGRGAYRGPIRAYGATVPPLVIAVRHDPATPYRGGQRLARDLGARLLTVQGDGHGAIANPCVANATLAYLTELNVPSPGATCTEPGPFSSATASAARTLSPAAVRLAVHRVQRRRLGALPLPGLVGRAAGQRR